MLCLLSFLSIKPLEFFLFKIVKTEMKETKASIDGTPHRGLSWDMKQNGVSHLSEDSL